ncbi:hypothetical protein [Frankia gtarii]|nr:hypothetical protein [Frankia gtarii]
MKIPTTEAEATAQGLPAPAGPNADPPVGAADALVGLPVPRLGAAGG